MREKAPVIVLDGHLRSALAVTRSLGRSGLDVIVVTGPEGRIAAASRHATKEERLPSPGSEPEAFVAMLTALCDRYAPALVVPMTELTTELCLTERRRLPEGALPLPSDASMHTSTDKYDILELAREAGIACPNGRLLDSAETEGLQSCFDVLGSPIILKPRRSWTKIDGQWQRFGVRSAPDVETAADIIGPDGPLAKVPVVAQEFLPGHGEGVFLAYDRGRRIAHFAHRRIREKPPSGGVSVLCESRDPVPEVLASATRLLDALGWHGVAMVEFRVDSRTGTPYLMEINPRFWGSLQLAIDCGVDFPAILHAMTTDRAKPSSARYMTGRRLRWLLGDFDAMLIGARNGDLPWRDRLRAVAEFLLTSPLRTRFEINRFDDPVPALQELREWIGALRR